MSAPTREAAAKRTKWKQAAGEPCRQCPWRVSNQGRPHPDGWYTKANLRRLWTGLRRGVRMTCHPTDPANPVPEGGRPVPEGTATAECAGALILQQRELQRFSDIAEAGKGLADYRRENPMGLTRDGLGEVIAGLMFGDTPLFGTGLDMAKPNLNCADVAYAPLVPWEPR